MFNDPRILRCLPDHHDACRPRQRRRWGLDALRDTAISIDGRAAVLLGGKVRGDKMGYVPGSVPKRMYCFYCGSILRPNSIKCDACNAPVRRRAMDERTANSIIQRLEPIYGVSALRFELEATKQSIGEVFIREAQKAIASWKRQR
jgi:hypothetical protein